MKNTEIFFMITPEEFEKIGEKYGLAVQFYKNCRWYSFPDANDKYDLDYFFIKYTSDGKICYSSTFTYNIYAKRLLGSLNVLEHINCTIEELEVIVQSSIKRYKEDKLKYLENLKLYEIKKDF